MYYVSDVVLSQNRLSSSIVRTLVAMKALSNLFQGRPSLTCSLLTTALPFLRFGISLWRWTKEEVESMRGKNQDGSM